MDDSETTTSADEPHAGHLFDALSNARRRVVWALAALGVPADVDTLAGLIVSFESADATASTNRKRRRSVRNILRNRHLETLADAGIITRADQIEPGPTFQTALHTLAVAAAAHSAVTHD